MPACQRRLATVLATSLLLVSSARALPPGQDATRSIREVFKDVLHAQTMDLDHRTCGVDKRLPDLAFVDLDGRAGRLSDYAEDELVVIAIRHPDCPYREHYGAVLAGLEREFAGQGVAFLFLDPSPTIDPHAVRSEIEALGLQGRYVHDPDQGFTRALGVEATAAVFVVDRARTLRYRGAIDDLYGPEGKIETARTHYLRAAIEHVLASEAVLTRATIAAGAPLDIPREEPSRAPSEITFHADVQRILQANCVECHHEGGAGPFALDEYERAFDRRRMVRMVVEERIMPPWFADEATGPWRNDRRLSDADRETVLAWIENGAPQGHPADAPVPLDWSESWVIGEPDEIFQLKHEQELPAEGTVEWKKIWADRKVPYDMWVERLQILPTNRAVVHHATVEFRPPWRQDDGSRDALMGTLLPYRRPQKEWQGLTVYVPGKGAQSTTPGVGFFLPQGSTIRFGMHYTPNGKQAVDRTRLGVVLTDDPPRFTIDRMGVRNQSIVLAPGATGDFGGEVTIEEDTVLLEVTPHMHLRGRRFTGEIVYTDGSSEPLIQIPEWDQDWQFAYTLRQGRVLPKGTRVRINGWFDNSANNPNNPDPGQWVYYGDQIWDEMLTLGLMFIKPFDQVQGLP